MARPLRLEVSGGLYHVTSRGNRREHIYLGDDDRRLFLGLVGQVCERFSWGIYAWCLMNNNYHLLLETRLPNLSRGMRQLNGVYTQRFNRRHDRTGHVFEGRYKAQLVQKDRYLLAVCRYVVLTPVRAGAVRGPNDWRWTSFRATAGTEPAPAWLRREEVLALFGAADGAGADQYARFVDEGIGKSEHLESAKRQPYLGEDRLADRVKKAPQRIRAREIPKAHRRPLAKELGHYRRACRTRDEAMARAYLSGVFTMREIGDYFGVHYMTVSRAVQQFEAARGEARSRSQPA
jgi:REP element-mobilizing transposase RayT